MNICLTPEEKAESLQNKFGKRAVAVVNEIIKYSPNRPLEEIDPLKYFEKVKEILKNG